MTINNRLTLPIESGNGHNHAIPPTDEMRIFIEYRLDFSHSHAIGYVLFVGENEKGHACEMLRRYDAI